MPCVTLFPRHHWLTLGYTQYSTLTSAHYLLLPTTAHYLVPLTTATAPHYC